jgi:hypothetical protein
MLGAQLIFINPLPDAIKKKATVWVASFVLLLAFQITSSSGP